MTDPTTPVPNDTSLTVIAREAVMASRHLDAAVRILIDSVQHHYPGSAFSEAWVAELVERIQRSALLVKSLPIEEPCESV